MRPTLAVRVAATLLLTGLFGAPPVMAQQAAASSSAAVTTNASQSATPLPGPRRMEEFPHVADSSAASLSGGVRRANAIPVTTLILGLLILIVLILVL